MLAATLLLNASLAGAEPVGGVVTAGVGSMTQLGGTTTVTQSSANLSLNWQSFNIGLQERVNFVQPSASAIAVNRIYDRNGSQILGRISANGQVYLINPNGILFGRGAQVDVGALVASTLDVSDSSLGQGARTFSGAGTGSIVNHGSLHAASGGYVALLGSSVSNQGRIEAPQGFAALGAGQAVTLSFLGSRMVGIQVDQSALNALADNGGLIRADGGQVVLSAGAKDALLASVVNNSGTIEARTAENHEGQIVLLGGMNAGTVTLSGTLDASAPQGGNGGYIDTSAARVSVADTARVTTAASAGRTGTWLIDPTDFTIGQGSTARSDSRIGAETLAASLLSNNVSIATSAAANGSDAGDIHVNAALTWSANQLTLTAHRDININAVMTAKDTASLNLQPTTGHVNAGFDIDGRFAGRVDFVGADGTSLRSGSGFLKIGQNDYTVIASAAQLQAMSAGTYCALGSNITAEVPFTSVAGFTTAFDGLGHTIANLSISGAANTGLFATATGAAISNVGLLGGTVTGAAGTGALVGHAADSIIRNSFSTASVAGAAGTGGLVGSMVGAVSAISNSYATGNVGQNAGGAGTGGLVGSLASGAGNISNSHATGEVTSMGASTGGLVGSTSASGYIGNSYATGRVQGDGAGTGGLVGSSAASAGIINSYAMGSVESVAAGTGGLVGSNTSGVIFRSFALGNVNGGGAGTGGLAGSNTSGTISESFAAGTVTGSAHSIAAPAPTAATVGASTGGLVGSNSGTLLNTYAAGNVTGYAAGIGGLVGDNFGSITKSYSAGTVTAGTGGTGVGGLVGFGSGTVKDTNSYRIAGNAVDTVAQSSTAVSSVDLAHFTTAASTQGGNPAWDFNTIWTMPASTASYLYPIFKGLVKEITVTASSASKIYDGQAYDPANNRSTSSSTSSSPINAALVQLNYSPAASWIDAATYFITPTATVSNAYLTPYLIVKAVAGTLTVTPKALSATATSAGKTYDGTTTASATLDLTGLVGTQTLGSTATATFNSADVLTANQVTVGSVVLSDSGTGATAGKASNYTLAGGQQVDATIAAKALSATATFAGKTYDGTTTASATLDLTGLVGTQTLGSTATATFNSADVLTANQVTVGSVVLSDSGTGATAGKASNYTLAGGQQVDATIAAKALSVSDLSAVSRFEDGTENAVLSGGTFSGLVGLETLALTGQFDNEDVGDNKPVTLSLVNGLNGGKVSNYSLSAPVDPLTASIWAALDIAVPPAPPAPPAPAPPASAQAANAVEDDRLRRDRPNMPGAKTTTVAALKVDASRTTTQVIDGGVLLP